MKSLNVRKMLLLAAIVWVTGVALPNGLAVAQDKAEFATRKLELKAGRTIEYGYIEPDDFDSSKEYPILLALPPGAQNRQMVKASFDLYWNQGGKRGWVVIGLVAPEGRYFTKGSEFLIPDFLETIKRRYKPAGGKFHLTGISNGGTSAFRIAGLYPDQFHSMMVMPGFPKTSRDQKNLAKLKDLPVAMYVGSQDSGWVKQMEEAAKSLEKHGAAVTFEKVAGQGHVIQNWGDGKKLFDQLDKWHAAIAKD